jgi:hypothetical protein
MTPQKRLLSSAMARAKASPYYDRSRIPDAGSLANCIVNATSNSLNDTDARNLGFLG